MKEFGIIYMAHNNINGKIYIGQTVKGLKRRKLQHLSRARNGHDELVLYRSIRKYGEDSFSWKILEICYSSCELEEMEYHYIKQYDSIKNGYNLYFNVQNQAGKNNPNYGNKMSLESRNSISKLAKERLKDKRNHPFYKKAHSEETKQKLRLINLNRPLITEETREKMSLAQRNKAPYTINSKKIRRGKDHHSYGKPLSESRKEKMSSAFSGKDNPFYGKRHSEKTKELMRNNHYDCSGVNNSMYGKVGSKSPNAKKYVVINPEGREFIVHGLHNFCKLYKKANLHSYSMVNCAKGKQYTHKGHTCRYYKEDDDFNLLVWGGY